MQLGKISSPKMRTFKLVRTVDVSGVSGTGIVAEGVEFENGCVAMHWLSQYGCVGVYDNTTAVTKIHGHDGSTKIVFYDEEQNAG